MASEHADKATTAATHVQQARANSRSVSGSRRHLPRRSSNSASTETTVMRGAQSSRPTVIGTGRLGPSSADLRGPSAPRPRDGEPSPSRVGAAGNEHRHASNPRGRSSPVLAGRAHRARLPSACIARGQRNRGRAIAPLTAGGVIASSRVGWPGASQPPAPTNPGVTVSRHRALLIGPNTSAPSASG